jgi:hypothetical protein
MNQTNSKNLYLTADQARNLQADILALMAQVIASIPEETQNSTVVMTGVSDK